MHMDGKRITPERGKIYRNKGGGKFLCIRGFDGNAVMQNIASGWTFKANGVIQYEDGTIEWDYSTGGHFEHCSECRMLRLSGKTNDLLPQVIERFRFHHGQTKSDNPIVAEEAEKMCEIEIWEMWALTQG